MGKQLKRMMRPAPDAAGFAAHWAWIWCVFWSSQFYNEMQNLNALELMPSGILEPLWVLSLGTNVLALAVLLMVSRRRNPLALVRWLPAVAALATCAGTLCISHVTDFMPAPWPGRLYAVGSVLTGAGSAAIVVLWAERFTSFGPRRLVHCFVAAVLAAVVAYIALMFLPTLLFQCLTACMPLVGMGIYMAQEQKSPRVPLGFRNVAVRGPVPWMLVAIALLFGLSFGLMKGLLAPATPQWIELRDWLNVVAIAGAAVAVYVTMAVLKMDFDHLTYQVALPLMAAGFLFLPLHEPYSIIGTAVHQFGYQYFYIVLWAIWSTVAAHEKVPAAWIVTLGLLAIQLGQLAGSLGADVALHCISSDLGKAMISSSCIFAILLASLFVFGSRSASTAWGYVRPMEEIEEAGGSTEAAIEALSRRFRLTPRESDVFALLARGRNRAFICADLVIGEETVKSHVKSIYRKLAVHSQQDLINLVEEERANR